MRLRTVPFRRNWGGRVMPEKKIIAVIGATGAQGGGLVRAILTDPSGGYTARAIARNVTSEKARELAKL